MENFYYSNCANKTIFLITFGSFALYSHVAGGSSRPKSEMKINLLLKKKKINISARLSLRIIIIDNIFDYYFCISDVLNVTASGTYAN